MHKSLLNLPMPDSKSAQSWYFFSILEISNFLGFQNFFPKLHESSWFRNFFVFPLNSLFFCLSYTRQILKKSDAKRNDHVFPKLNEPSWFLQIFVWENNIFHIFYFLFPDWYIDETIRNLIFKIFMFVSRLIHSRNSFRV